MVEITREHMAFVERVAHRYSSLETYDDVCGYGMIGLVQAAARFDRSQGDFLGYASIRVCGAMVDGLRELGRLSRRDMRREGDEGELIRLRARVLTLDAGVRQADGDTADVFDTLADPDAPDPLAEAIAEDRRAEVSDALTRALARLTEMQSTAVAFYFFDEDLTQGEIAELLGVTESRVSQLIARGLELLAEDQRLQAVAA